MDQKGFSLIEILAVLGIISILSAIAIPRYTAVRERAYVSTMIGDLHNLRLAQELYQRAPDHNYAPSLQDLGDGFTTSPGVTITILSAGVNVYSAQATHQGTLRVCTYETDDGVVRCTAPEGKDDDNGK